MEADPEGKQLIFLLCLSTKSLVFAERIVMTPKKKTSLSTTLKMERKRIVKSGGAHVHVAGGTNAGIVVNKQSDQDDDVWAEIPAHLCLEFRVFLVNTATKKYTQEKRIISYWFKDLFAVNQRATAAQDFFKTLVSPADFPRGNIACISCSNLFTFCFFNIFIDDLKANI